MEAIASVNANIEAIASVNANIEAIAILFNSCNETLNF
jgi:hypothetical protein